MRLQGCLLAACSLLLLHVPPVRAGMPAPLPSDPVLITRLTDSAVTRLQTISFFLAAIGLSALVARLLWNYLCRDFPNLPRLSYGRALAGVLLWGLLFLVVLTMISGARELMTPRAWQKQGFTYQLATQGAQTEADPAALRKQALERLRTALWHFAATHGGRFPSGAEGEGLPRDLWEVPATGGMRFVYVPGLSATEPAATLVFAPELESGVRLVLRSDGTIVSLRAAEIEQALAQGAAP